MKKAILAILCLATAAMGVAVEHPVSVLGRVYIDVNCNGCIDSQDVLVNGVNIQLQKANGDVVGIAQTGEFGLQGVYAFPSDLAPISPQTGTTYTLSVLYPNGYYPRNAFPGPYSNKVNNGVLRFNLPTEFTNTASSYDFLIKRNGCFFTENQCGWGKTWHWCWHSDFLTGYFDDVYGSGSVTIGGENTLTFTSPYAIKQFLPQNGNSKVLTSSEVNPRWNKGDFAANVLCLQLSVDFSDKGVTTAFLGEQRIRYGKMEGSSVREVLAIANEVLGGNLGALPANVSLSKLNQIVETILENYNGGHENHGYLDW